LSNVAVITGASRGIGRACALALAGRGLDVALLGRPSPQHEEARRSCEERGARALSYECDMGDAAAVELAARALLSDFGAPRVVLHNAAELEHGPRVHEIAVDRWDRQLAVNLRGPFVLARALLPAMLAAGRGRHLFVSSISGTIGSPKAAAYAASKWGLLGLCKSLAEELRGTGLSALAVVPGSVDTDMLAQTPFSADIAPEEIAGVVSYCALDAPDAMNGSFVEVFGA
jgi:3-oxoacyl-[acyl-carrier protein] reductase